MQQLARRWERARGGEGQFVQIVGEPGLGKSRLIEEFRARLAETPHTWIEWASSQLLQNTPLHPLAEWGRQRFGGAEIAPEKRIADLEAALSAGQARSDRVRAAARAAARHPSRNGRRCLTLAPEELRRRQLAAVVAWMLAGARAQPLVLAFEDLHWADPTTLDLMKMLAERGAQAPLLIVATARPEFRAPWPTRSHHGDHFACAARPRSRCARWSASSPSATRFPSDGVEGRGRPHRRRAAVRRGGDAADAGGRRADRSRRPCSNRSPRGSTGSARRAKSRRSARCSGGSSRSRCSLAIAGPPSATLSAGAGEARRRGLVVRRGVAPDSRYRFKHALIQDAAYESMLRSRRREIHRQIAEALIRLQPAIAETSPETLATHLERAGDDEGAATYWQKAGLLAQRNSAYQEAIGAYNNALRLMNKQGAAFIEINRALASAHFAAGEHELNHKHLADAAAAAEAGGDPVILTEIAIQQCHVLSQFGGDTQEAIDVGRRALEMANDLADPALAYGARFALGHACWINGAYERTIELLTANLPENLSDTTRIRDFGTAGSLQLDSMSILGSTLAHRGLFDRGLALLDRAQALPQKNAFDIAVVSFHHARAHLFRGEASAASAMAQAAIAHASHVGL